MLEIQPQSDAVVRGDVARLNAEGEVLPVATVLPRQKVGHGKVSCAKREEVVANPRIARMIPEDWIPFVHAGMVLDVQRLPVVQQQQDSVGGFPFPFGAVQWLGGRHASNEQGQQRDD